MEIALAMEPRLFGRFFDEDAQRRLHSMGNVEIISSWQDLREGDAPVSLSRAEVLVTGWGTGGIDDAVLDSAPQLRSIIHSAGSVKGLIPEGCYDRGISVSSQAELNALPVAEYALAMILLAGKDVIGAQQGYRSRRENDDPHAATAGIGNYGRRVGIVGASKIGVRLIELLSPFDLEIVVYDPFLDYQRARQLGVRGLSLDELMATCSVVSLHAPLNPSTRGMIGARQLALLPDGATLINTARGDLIDEHALIRELQAGRIKAVLDVLGATAADSRSPIWNLPNVVLTPHLAGALGNELRRLGEGVLADLEDIAVHGRMSRAIPAEAFALLA